jgi:hypothetical protein
MKKIINVRFDLNEEVYFIYNNKIIKQPIEKCKILVQPEFIEGHLDGTFTEHNGITIEYLFLIESIYPNRYSNVWINQDDIYKTKEELINKID